MTLNAIYIHILSKQIIYLINLFLIFDKNNL